jgi:hypothetical protein
VRFAAAEVVTPRPGPAVGARCCPAAKASPSATVETASTRASPARMNTTPGRLLFQFICVLLLTCNGYCVFEQ